jgi:uncharacterized membrane protein
MKSKKIIIIILILAIAIAVGYFYLEKKPIIIFQAPVTSIQDIKIIDNTNPFKINIVYPEITGFDDYNKKVKEIIDNEIKNFKAYSLENDAAVKTTDPTDYAKYPRTYELDIDYTKGEIDKTIISVMFNVYNFEGGAHGATYFVPLNYNISKKAEIKLADLFPNQKDYLQKISAYCIQDLTKQITARLESTDGTWIEDGAGPVEDNFQFFLINSDNTITFYFPQYQVAYGAAGDFKVIFAR